MNYKVLLEKPHLDLAQMGSHTPRMKHKVIIRFSMSGVCQPLCFHLLLPTMCCSYRPWSPCQPCFHLLVFVFAISDAWTTFLCPGDLFILLSLVSSVHSLKGIFPPIFFFFFCNRAICHNLCDCTWRDSMMRNEEMAVKLRPGGLCIWKNTSSRP